MIENLTRKERIVSSAVPVKGILRQAFGLQFRRKLVDEGWVFLLPWSSSWDVTNLFVFQDIDVLWLDEKRRVLKKSTVPSWRPHVSGHPRTSFLIELPAGRAAGVRVGDAISWTFR